METISSAIQGVQSLYSKGVQGKDTDLSPRHIYYYLLKARSTLVRQQSNKNQYISSWIYQTLPAVELIATTVYENTGLPTGETILRSKYKLPQLVSDLKTELIKSVTTLDGSKRYDIGSFETEKYSAGNKYTANKPGVFIHEGYLYLSGETSKKAITVVGIFEDPIEVYKFPKYNGDCSECDCIDVTTYDMRIDGNLGKTLINMATQELLGTFVQMRKDKENNASDDAGVKTMLHK